MGLLSMCWSESGSKNDSGCPDRITAAFFLTIIAISRGFTKCLRAKFQRCLADKQAQGVAQDLVEEEDKPQTPTIQLQSKHYLFLPLY